MAKNKNDYFKLIEEQGFFCVQASALLSEILCNHTATSIPAQRNKIHEIEIAAKGLRLDILNRLSAELITPIDQEDILHLLQIIDDIIEALDKAILGFDMFNITYTPTFAPSISKKVDACIKALYEAIKELKNFKKPTVLLKSLDYVNNLISEAYTIYVEAIRHLLLMKKILQKQFLTRLYMTVLKSVATNVNTRQTLLSRLL